MNELNDPGVKPIQQPGEVVSVTDAAYQDQGTLEQHTLVGLPNGTSFDFVASVSLGDVLIASAVFLLLSFQVIKWILDHAWGRR